MYLPFSDVLYFYIGLVLEIIFFSFYMLNLFISLLIALYVISCTKYK